MQHSLAHTSIRYMDRKHKDKVLVTGGNEKTTTLLEGAFGAVSWSTKDYCSVCSYTIDTKYYTAGVELYVTNSRFTNECKAKLAQPPELLPQLVVSPELVDALIVICDSDKVGHYTCTV